MAEILCAPERLTHVVAARRCAARAPESWLGTAVAAGATQISPVTDEHGWRLGRLDDPFGHQWEIGHPVGTWPPAR